MDGDPVRCPVVDPVKDKDRIEKRRGLRGSSAEDCSAYPSGAMAGMSWFGIIRIEAFPRISRLSPSVPSHSRSEARMTSSTGKVMPFGWRTTGPSFLLGGISRCSLFGRETGGLGAGSMRPSLVI
jgi:hypothetical protein